MYAITGTWLLFLVASRSCLQRSTRPANQDSNNRTHYEREISSIGYNFTEEFLGCHKLKIQPQHYELLANSSVFVPEYERLYEPGNYYVSDGVLLICDAPATVTNYSGIQNETYGVIRKYEVPANATGSEEDFTRYSEAFLECPKTMVEPEHYQLLENSSVFVPRYGIVYNANDYYIGKGTLYICAHTYLMTRPYTDESKNDDQIARDITLVCLILSIVCLGLHLCVFAIVPEYRTLNGKNTASIAACLFVGYILFLVAGKIHMTNSCARMAVAVCYFFLSSFFWMNAFAFDVWLSLSTSMTRVHSFIGKTKESVRYMIYLGYSFGMPMIIVSILTIVDYRGVKDSFSPVFDNVRCWFRSQNSFIVFFITPYVTLTVLNVIFFSLSIVAISRIKISNGKHELSPRRRFIVCTRLAAVTGMPWFMGIIAMTVNWRPLWHAFIVLTTVQAVYIFVVYNCNKKTLKHIAARYRGEKKCVSVATEKSFSAAV